MTCYVACKLIDQKRIYKNDIISISKHAYKMIGTTAKLKPGDKLSLIDLIHGYYFNNLKYKYDAA